MAEGFADHFSGHAADYAKSRPTYPTEMFDWLADCAPSRALAWDCATGNGQAAVELASRFDAVIATDGSGDQLEHREQRPNIRYAQAVAEVAPLAGATVDLCTVAQAAHWFELDRYFAEVSRVGKPGAICAIWCYVMCNVSTEVDAVIDHLYGPVVGEFWPDRRHHVETEYRELPMPFDELDAPPFAMRCHWDLDQLCAYFRTWSATQRYLRATGDDPVALVHDDLRAAWGGGTRDVVWPIHLRVGRIER